MAEQDPTTGAATPVAPTGGAAASPKVWPWLFLHTVGRLGLFALLTVALWMLGLDFWSGLLFGLLLSMPLAYLLLRRSREQLSVALAARHEERKRAKEELRARLSGEED